MLKSRVPQHFFFPKQKTDHVRFTRCNKTRSHELQGVGKTPYPCKRLFGCHSHGLQGCPKTGHPFKRHVLQGCPKTGYPSKQHGPQGGTKKVRPSRCHSMGRHFTHPPNPQPTVYRMRISPIKGLERHIPYIYFIILLFYYTNILIVITAYKFLYAYIVYII